MTFRNGKLKVLGDIQFGVQTGDPRSWTSFDEVWKAFCTQLEHLARHALIQQHVAMRLKPQYCAAPATSMLHDLAMAECRDLYTHGEYFPCAIDHSTFEAIGKGTAVDSLAAVKHLIFDTKSLTWDQLLEAMEANWEGHEAVRQLCLSAPKYGNGIQWVDAIGYDIETVVLEFLHKHPKPHNQAFLLRQIPVTFQSRSERLPGPRQTAEKRTSISPRASRRRTAWTLRGPRSLWHPSREVATGAIRRRAAI